MDGSICHGGFLPILHGHLHLPAWTILQPRRQNLTPLLRHQQCMLKLRRPRPIHRDTSPVIRPNPVPITARANHRFNRKTHARLRHADSFVLRIMRDIGRTVEESIDAVADIRRDDRATIFLGVFLDCVADVAEGEAGFDGFDSEAEAFAGGFDEVDVFAVEGRGPDVVGFVEVTVVTTVVEGDVEVEDVAVEEDAGVGDTVADYFIGGGADGFGEIIVV